MNYLCKPCNYETDDKSNYNRHLKSSAHIHVSNVSTAVSTDDTDDTTVKYNCNCGKEYVNRSGLFKHKKKCNNPNNNIEEKLNSLKSQLEEHFKKETESLKKQLNEYIQNGKSPINVSVKNYVQNNYPNAPALEGIKEYDKLTFENTTLKGMITELVSQYNNNSLHKFLGKFIISYYKKEDPKLQSMWSSDVARLTYVIKEFLDKNKSVWSHDFKGVKIKTFIINPLLNHIRKKINKYWIYNIQNVRNAEVNDIVKYNQMYTSLYKIKSDMTNDVLSSEILKFIAPYFMIAKKIVGKEELDDMFIVDE